MTVPAPSLTVVLTVREKPPNAGTGERKRMLRATNLRRDTVVSDTTLIRGVQIGELVTVYPGGHFWDTRGEEWAYVEVGTQAGWMQRTGNEWSEQFGAPPPADPGLMSIGMSDDEFRQLIALYQLEYETLMALAGVVGRTLALLQRVQQREAA